LKKFRLKAIALLLCLIGLFTGIINKHSLLNLANAEWSPFFKVGRMYVNPPFQIVNLLGNISVSVIIESIVDMFGYEFRLYWDSSILECTQWNATSKEWIQNPSTPPPQWENNYFTAVNNITKLQDGRARYWISIAAIPPAQPATGTFVVATLNFRVKGIGQTAVDLANTEIGDYDANPICHDVADGLIVTYDTNNVIRIRVDGNVDPPDAPIHKDGTVYTFTQNIIVNNSRIGVIVEKNNIIIDGARHILQGNGEGVGIFLAEVSNVTVTNLEVKYFEFGIWVNTSINNIFSSSRITSNVHGVYFWGSSHNKIIGNNITANSKNGIILGNSSNYNVLFGNIVSENLEYGITFHANSSHNQVMENIILSNKDGIAIYSSSFNGFLWNKVTGNNFGIMLGQGVYNNLTENLMQANTFCIILCSSSNNSVEKNLIKNNYDGFELVKAQKNKIIGNNITLCQRYGVFATLSFDNQFYYNNFQGNEIDVYSISSRNMFDCGYPYGGNFWHKYSGSDANNDGIGDEAYMIDEQNVDHYPLMKPWSSHDIVVLKINTSKTIIGQGFVLKVNATIINRGIYTEDFQVTMYVNQTSLFTINMSLNTISFIEVCLKWNTTNYDKGKYIISISVTGVLNETALSDNLRSTIVQVTKKGDITGDNKVNVLDLISVAAALGCSKGDSKWNPNADIKEDGIINVLDLILVSSYLGS
jgi:parallel beta-helix repeat protein